MNDSEKTIAKLRAQIRKLKRDITKLKTIKIPENLTNTFFVKDQYGRLALAYGTPLKGYESPVIKTKVTRQEFVIGVYDKKTLKEFKFPLTGNIIFRGGYAIDPESFEGQIITKIILRQGKDLRENEKQTAKVEQILKMDTKQILEYLSEEIKTAKEAKSKKAMKSKGNPKKRIRVGPEDTKKTN